MKFHPAVLLLFLPVLALAQPGSWTTQTLPDTPTGIVTSRVMDFDQDGDLDILIAQSSTGTYWLENQDFGQMWVQRPISNGGLQGKQLPVGDIDGDGDYDVAVGNYEIVVMINGDLEFTAIVPPTTVEYDIATFGDVDDDGRDEIIVFTSEPQSSVQVYSFDDGEWTFTTLIEWPDETGIHGLGLDIADWDDDGDQDIIYSHNKWQLPQSVLLRNDGGGEWSAHELALNGLVKNLKMVDIDDDGLLDVLGYSGGFSLHRQLPNGELESHYFGVYGSISQSALADIDRDGDYDVVMADFEGMSWAEQVQPDEYVLHPLERSTTTVSAGDFDLDGDHDVVSMPPLDNAIQIHWHDGQPAPLHVRLTTEFEPPVVVPPGGSFTYDLRLIYRRTTPGTAMLWTDAITSDGAVVGPFATVNMALTGMDTLRIDELLQQVPLSATEGSYQFRLSAGPTLQQPWASAQFEVIVQE